MMVDFTGIENSKPCPDCRQALVTKDRCERCQALADCRSGSAELAKWLEEWRVKLNDVTAERDQLRAEVEDIRQQRDYWQEEAVEMRRYKEASESLVAGLRGALELLLKCNALGVAIPWGKAVSALAEADRLEKEAANGK